MFGKLKKVAAAFHIPTQREREIAYLNGSANVYDLEHRMRRIDRGDFRNSGF